jgi:hypothetical protein
MEAGADQTSPLTADQLKTLLHVASYAAQQDPDNAFWEQMKAVFHYSSSKLPTISAPKKIEYTKEFLEDWRKASNRSRWDDYQTRRLEEIQKELASEAGSNAAWQFAAVYPLRESGSAKRIVAVARDLLRGLDNASKESMLLRYEILMNGKLIRDGSRSVEIGSLGATLVEISSYPKEAIGDLSPHPMVLARIAFFNTLMHLGLRDQAHTVHEVFNSNDGWLAFTRESDLGVSTRRIREASIVTIGLPGALLAISLVGGLFWGTSTLMKRRPELLKVVEPPLAPALGIILGVLVYWATGLILASVAIIACFGFLAFTPVHERKRAPEQLGLVFELTVFVLSCMFCALLVALFIGLSTPGCQVLPFLNVPKDYYGGSTLLVGLGGIVLGLLLLAAPSWALIQRIPTPVVVLMALKQFGRGIFWGCLALAIIATPLCVASDRYLQAQLGKVVGNEPLYYQVSQ